MSKRLIGLYSAMVYAANAIHYGWSPANRNWIDDAGAWATCVALLALYWAGYRALRQVHGSNGYRGVILPAIPLVLISFFTIPYDSTDAFLYIAIGQAETHYGMNPYTTVLREMPEALDDPAITTDWMRTNLNPWRDLPLVYGFAFAQLIKGLAWLGHGHWWLTLALLKLVNLLAYGVTAAMLWRIAIVLGQPRPDLTLYLFTWSPLILLHHIANAHNDILMGCLIVLSFYLLIQRKSIWAPASLALATLIKYVTLPLIPIFLLHIAKRDGWRRAAVSAVLAAIPAIVLSLPYANTFAGFRFDLMEAQLNKITAGSLYAFFFYLYRFLAPSASLAMFGSILKGLLWTVTALIVIREIVRFRRREKPSIEDLLSICTAVLFAVIFIGSSQFYSWYIGMLFPAALLLHSQHWLRQFMILLSGTHIFSLTSLSRKGIGYFLMTTGLALGAMRVAQRWKVFGRFSNHSQNPL